LIPQDFLRQIAKEHSVSNTELDVLAAAINGEPMNAIAQRLGIRPEAARKRLGEVYKKFHIAGAGPGKLAKLQQILVSQYQTRQTQGPIVAIPVTPEVEVGELPPQYDWGEAPDISAFYGRAQELTALQTWISQDHCRVVALLGIAGIGKTALAVRLARSLEEQDEFEFIIWRSLRHGVSPREVIGRLVQTLSRKRQTYLPDSAHNRITLLIDYLRQHRCLLVLDGVESVLRQGDISGQYRDGFEDYGELLRRVGEESHQSCLLLTSSEKPREVARLEGNTLPVRVSQLGALGPDEAGEIFRDKGLQEEKLWKELIDLYRGNPLTLKIASTTIQELFGGRVSEFLKQSTLVFGDIRDLLQRQFDRLSDIERAIVYWLAIEQQPLSLSQLRDKISIPFSQPELIEALESLGRRSLIERGAAGGAMFGLQPVVLEYVTQEFTDRACYELQDLLRTQKIDRLELFRTHALEASEGKDTGPILPAVKDRLRKLIRNDRQLEGQLDRVLAVLQAKFPLEVGYATSNVQSVLDSLRLDLPPVEA